MTAPIPEVPEGVDQEALDRAVGARTAPPAPRRPATAAELRAFVLAGRWTPEERDAYAAHRADVLYREHVAALERWATTPRHRAGPRPVDPCPVEVSPRLLTPPPPPPTRAEVERAARAALATTRQVRRALGVK